MAGHHGDIRAPILQPYEHSHPYLVHAGPPHAVEAVAAPLEFRLHPGGMIHLVAVAVVGLLEADHAVETRPGQPLVIFGAQGHHLDGEVAEIAAAHLQGLLQVVGAGHGGVFARHQQQILKRAHGLDGLALLLDLRRGEHHAGKLVVAVETAVDTRVGARIGDVHRYEDAHRLAEAALGDGLAAARHLLEIGSAGRRDERHEVTVVEMLLGKSTLHVGGGHRLDLAGSRLPVVIFF